MSKFIPGPWRAIEREVLEDGSVYPWHIVGGDRELVVCYLEAAMCASAGTPHAEVSIASARLIEAAPKMYGLIKQYLKTADNPLGMTALADLDAQARALLARINGDA